MSYDITHMSTAEAKIKLNPIKIMISEVTIL